MNDQRTSSDEPINREDVELKWQARWHAAESFKWRNDSGKPKFYVLEMFPYTSGRLHMGHARNFAMGDVVARMQRALGFDVLYPMGWDSFGLPAENSAIKMGQHPAESTQDAIVSMRTAMDRLGLSYDWDCEIDTSSASYIAAQQLLFVRFFQAGLVYRDTRFANWCDTDQTVLADEQVVDGRCWRCDSEVTKRRVPQWLFDIRRYANELVDSLDGLDGWPDRIKNIQRSWIGRSTGAIVRFELPSTSVEPLSVFTTRVDTLMGCTFLLLSPEHQLLDSATLPPETSGAVRRFRDDILSQTKQERQELKDKAGVYTGWKARHPITGEDVPVWVANYVLMDYGTGAVMAVPAHDQRDLEFARKYDLPVRPVISPDGGELAIGGEAFLGEGVLINSGEFDGFANTAAAQKIAEYLSGADKGSLTTTYRLQNWSISRQRYWGNPIPIIYCNEHGAVPVPESDLPILLPADVDFMNSARAILSSPTFVEAQCPICGGPGRREIDTMDTFVDSSWYFLRFLSPACQEPFDRSLVDRMMPVDLYIGGIEHATLHLIYARFFVKALRDLGMLDFGEPFIRLENQGMVNDSFGQKQSKSKGNITEPASIIERYGADALRVYLLFTTAPENAINWTDDGPKSALAYLQRVWRLVAAHPQELTGRLPEPTDDPRARSLRQQSHRAIVKVRTDIGRFQFNTAIAELMSLTNALLLYPTDAPASALLEGIYILVHLLSPFAPHLAEEMWEGLGGSGLLAAASWPTPDPGLLFDEETDIVVQVGGKVVQTLRLPAGVAANEVEEAAMALPQVQRRLAGRAPSRLVYVPGKILNIVV